MIPPASCWTSSPGNWSLKVLWTDAPVPVASSASPTGEVPSVGDCTGGQEQLKRRPGGAQEQVWPGGGVDSV